MRTPLTKFSAILGATLLLAALSSCSEDPRPIIEPSAPTSSPPATPTPTATPTAPERESAKAFIRRWQDETYAMQSSGDASEYSAMTSDCSSCDALVDQVSKIYRDGRSVRIGGGKVFAIERVGKVDDVSIYEYQVNSKPSQILDSDGGVESRFTGGKSTFQINLSREQSSWVVLRVSGLAS